ncbi:MAG TPA: YqiA/YcfP family alpha/beta fold hydrolase [Terriglobales bacterium]|nr:YqiA/YcfP family alpha/beta fold hydrolase [Terriglobales bacterium]
MLYYLHGYLSGPNSRKGKLLRERFNALSINYHEGPPESLDVNEALRRIAETIEGDADPSLIGSSFGGFLAAKTALNSEAVKTIILLNPAIIPPGAKADKLRGIPDSILQQMRDGRLFGTKIKARIFLLIGLRDDVIPADWSMRFAKAQQARLTFLDDDHAFAIDPSRVLNVIEEILFTSC